MARTKIDVNINKATLTAIAVDIKKDGSIEVNGRLELFAGEKSITTVTVGTESWRSSSMDLPLSVYRRLGKIAKAIEEHAQKAFMDEMKQLKGEVSNES
jgi:hypothetical protein